MQVEERFDLSKIQLKGKLVIDLGANRGDFTKWAHNLGAKVIAVEPDPVAFHYLAKRVAKYKDVYLLNCAAYSETRLLNLYHHKNRANDPVGHTISSSLVAEKDNIDTSNFD